MLASATLDPSRFRTLLLAWYKQHQRPLPWRMTKDPYKIWLSEVILQQTRVAQGLPYYERFIAHYPSISALAEATEQEVLRLWQGLGYYSRARNLHHCAQTIVQEYQGVFPTTYKALLTLKGIGPYTAAAIAAAAFKEVVAAVDGNVYRVLARIFGLNNDIAKTEGRKQIHHLATSLVDRLQPDTYSQAIMDFGALQCTPLLPECTTCIFNIHCIAYKTNKQKTLPVKSKSRDKMVRYFLYVVFQYQDKLYMKKRAKGDIWQGMYDFYLIAHTEHLPIGLIEDPLLKAVGQHQLPMLHVSEVVHILTHQKLFAVFHKVELNGSFVAENQIMFDKFHLIPFTRGEIDKLPKPILIQNFLSAL